MCVSLQEISKEILGFFIFATGVGGIWQNITSINKNLGRGGDFLDIGIETKNNDFLIFSK